MKVDDVGIKICSMLAQNGRLTHKSIADELNYSRPAIHNRIDELEKAGVISGYEAKIDYGKLGLNISVFVLVNIHSFNFNDSISKIMDLSDEGIYIQDVYRITGNQCILIKLVAASTEKLRIFHDKMLKLSGLIETNTMLVMQSESNDFKAEYIKDLNNK